MNCLSRLLEEGAQNKEQYNISIEPAENKLKF
jgi:hypothetical protein